MLENSMILYTPQQHDEAFGTDDEDLEFDDDWFDEDEADEKRWAENED